MAAAAKVRANVRITDKAADSMAVAKMFLPVSRIILAVSIACAANALARPLKTAAVSIAVAASWRGSILDIAAVMMSAAASRREVSLINAAAIMSCAAN